MRPRLYRALHKVDFICVADLFMTPTASAVADLVLPVAMSPERDCLRVWFEPMRSLTKACAPYYEAKEDEQIMIDLGHRLSPDKWPDWVQAPRDYMNWRLDRDGVGMTMEDLEIASTACTTTPIATASTRRGLLRPDGQPGFMTPTGRYELYCTYFDAIGDDPLPYYEEPPTSPYSTAGSIRGVPVRAE